MICDEPQFIVYGSANGKVIIPDYLNSGNMLVVEPENCEAGTGSIVMTGGVLRMYDEEDTAYEMQQTGIITALGDPGTAFCERVLSLILSQFARVMILYPTWGGPDCNNLVVNSISDVDSVVTQIRQCFNVLSDGLGFSVYEAPSVDNLTDILEQVTFPDFLKWVPVPGDWCRVC